MPSTAVYATANDVRARIGKVKIDQDVNFDELLEGASRVVDGVCNQPDGFEAFEEIRVFTGTGTSIQFIDTCAQISLVEVKDAPDSADYVAWSASDWVAFIGSVRTPNYNAGRFDKIAAIPSGSFAFFTSGSYVGKPGFREQSELSVALPTVRITAKWGYSLVPPQQVKSATILQAVRWWKRGQTAYADAVGQPGEPVRYYKSMDADLQLMLKKSRLVAVANSLGRRPTPRFREEN